MGRWQRIKTKKHPKLTVQVTLCHYVDNQTGLKVASKPGEEKTMTIAAMPDTKPLICLMGRCKNTRMGITRHDLVETK